ncbi:MAG TPA: gluconokinase [Gammaproteobacteria bacterium]|nr:gluconokinase [Gammaproteobacteria bacterium]
MGVSGSGKTTIGRALARATGAAFFDADDFHPAANVEKMRRGEPLDEADRLPWLGRLRELVDEWLAPGRLAVLACSALTAHSRALLGVERAGVRLVFLKGPPELIARRMRRRRHFMPPELLGSQLETLEPPADALELDVRRPVDELVAEIRSAWKLDGPAPGTGARDGKALESGSESKSESKSESQRESKP